MKFIQALVLLQLGYLTVCMGELQERYGWKQIDYDYESPEERQQAIDSGAFIPENNLPMGIEVWDDKLFITIVRWRPGVPASLNYVNLSDSSTSPKLIPYPNWKAHSDKGGRPDIIAPYRVRADRCNRLWVLDSGGSFNAKKDSIKYKPAFLVYDLKTDQLLRRHEFSEDYIIPKSGYANLVVEDGDCKDTYVYAGDSSVGRIVAYSWKKDESWLIVHHYCNADPSASDFEVNGHTFRWTDAIFGMAISEQNAHNFSTLYFHPLSSFSEYSVSTKYLRDEKHKTNSTAFKKLGSRGPKTQSASSFIDQKTGVLFYTLIHLNAVGCWRTTNKKYTPDNQGRVFANNETMIYPADIKVDYNDNLWVISNKLPIWRYGTPDFNVVNFRVFSSPVSELINGTVCDVWNNYKFKL